MKFKFLHVYAFISLALIGSHAMTPEEYWKFVLPNSPMPKAIKDLLYTKATVDEVEKVSIDATSMSIKLKDQPKQHYSYVASTDAVKDHHQQFYIYGASKTEVKDQPQQFYIYDASKGEVKDLTQQFYIYGASKDEVKDQPGQSYIYGAPKGEVKDQPQQFYIYGATNDKTKDQSSQLYIYGASKDEVNDQSQPFYIYGESKDNVKDRPPQFYMYSDSSNQLSKNSLRNNQMANLLFLEKNLHQGEEIKLHFMKNDQKTAFLPKKVSDLIPFSSKDLPEIYNKFSVQPHSREAEIMKQTLSLCEYKGIEGEETFCATSLESMVDLSTSKFGKKVKALSTEVNSKESTPSQKYKIELAKKLVASKAMICHRQNYAYAVFYCHIVVGTQSYVVSLEGIDGTKVKSVAVCHTDTSKWNPKFLAFEVLKVSPGTPVCHFLPEDHVLWVPY